jgi:hypothetical protein
MSGRTIDIFFCLMKNMPRDLMSIAMQQGFDCSSQDLVAVKTKLSTGKARWTPFVYEFELIKPTPEGIRDYMEKLAKDDGVTDWNAALGRAFSDKFVPKLPWSPPKDECAHFKVERVEEAIRCADCGISLERYHAP